MLVASTGAPVFDRNRSGFELCSHHLEQQAIRPLSNQGLAEADKCRALGRSRGVAEAAAASEPPE